MASFATDMCQQGWLMCQGELQALWKALLVGRRQVANLFDFCLP